MLLSEDQRLLPSSTIISLWSIRFREYEISVMFHAVYSPLTIVCFANVTSTVAVSGMPLVSSNLLKVFVRMIDNLEYGHKN